MTAFHNAVTNELVGVSSLSMPEPPPAAPAEMTVAEWGRKHAHVLSAAKYGEEHSSRLRNEASHLHMKTSNHLSNTINDVHNRFENRIDNIFNSKEALVLELNHVNIEIAAMVDAKNKLESMLNFSSVPEEVAGQCLLRRIERQGVDLVRDMVEEELNVEAQTIKYCQCRLAEIFEAATEELRALRSVKHMLEADIHDKLEALCIERDCVSLQVPKNYPDPGPEVILADSTVKPPSWFRFSDENIQASTSERLKSEALREEIKMVIAEVVLALKESADRVMAAFEARTDQMRRAQSELEAQLQTMREEIETLEVAMISLENSVNACVEPLKIAKDRLLMRQARPNIEHVRDDVEAALKSEIAEIQTTISALRAKYADSYETLKSLRRSELRMQQDLDIKCASYAIDTQCIQLRKEAVSVTPTPE